MGVKPLNLVEFVKFLLLNGIDGSLIRGGLIRAGLSESDVKALLDHVEMLESNRLINLAHQYMDDMKKEVENLISLLK